MKKSTFYYNERYISVCLHEHKVKQHENVSHGLSAAIVQSVSQLRMHAPSFPLLIKQGFSNQLQAKKKVYW